MAILHNTLEEFMLNLFFLRNPQIQSTVNTKYMRKWAILSYDSKNFKSGFLNIPDGDKLNQSINIPQIIAGI